MSIYNSRASDGLVIHTFLHVFLWLSRLEFSSFVFKHTFVFKKESRLKLFSVLLIETPEILLFRYFYPFTLGSLKVVVVFAALLLLCIRFHYL